MKTLLFLEAEPIAMKFVDAIIPIVFFATMFGIFYLFITVRNKERMAMIEKGVDPSLFTSKKSPTSTFLSLGIFAVGVSIGIFGGLLFDKLFNTDDFYAPLIFLFAGLSLVAAYFVNRNVNKDNN